MAELNPFELFQIPQDRRLVLRVYTMDELRKFRDEARATGNKIGMQQELDAIAQLTEINSLRQCYAKFVAGIAPIEIEQLTEEMIIRPLLAPAIDEKGREYRYTGNLKDDLLEWMQQFDRNGISAYPLGYFLHFVQQGMDQQANNDITNETIADMDIGGEKHAPWKIHITTRDYYAVELLVELALEMHLPHIKVATYRDYEYFSKPGEKQQGKTVIFYHYDKNSKGEKIDWDAVCQIAEALVLLNGGVGPQVTREKLIEGSSALFRRCDLGLYREYVARDGLTEYLERHHIPDDRAFNILGLPDPWEHTKIKPFSLEDLRKIAAEAAAGKDNRQK